MKRIILTTFLAIIFHTAYGQIYKIGDIYSRYGYEGVVFYVDDTGQHGKIISLRNIRGCWATKSYRGKWYESKFIGATDSADGERNTRLVKSFEDWNICFPLFGKLMTLSGPSWYIPAKEELIAIAKASPKLNKTLSMYDYDLLDGSYYSSTEATGSSAWHVWMSNYSMDVYEIYKNTLAYGRPVAHF